MGAYSPLVIRGVSVLAHRHVPFCYLCFLRYSSIALRISALTVAPVFSERELSLLCCSSRRLMLVRFMLECVHLKVYVCQDKRKPRTWNPGAGVKLLEASTYE